eukprot:gene8520-10474_t
MEKDKEVTFVIRNLPYNLEQDKLSQILFSAFTDQTLKIVDFIQGDPTGKEIIPSRCYVKIVNKNGNQNNSDAFLDLMDGRPFINNKGVEEIALVEKVHYIYNEVNQTTTTPLTNKLNGTIESSKTFLAFQRQLNAPKSNPASLDDVLNDVMKQKNKPEDVSVIVEEVLAGKGLSKKHRKPRNVEEKEGKKNRGKKNRSKSKKLRSKKEKSTTTTTTTTTTTSTPSKGGGI